MKQKSFGLNNTTSGLVSKQIGLVSETVEGLKLKYKESYSPSFLHFFVWVNSRWCLSQGLSISEWLIFVMVSRESNRGLGAETECVEMSRTDSIKT